MKISSKWIFALLLVGLSIANPAHIRAEEDIEDIYKRVVRSTVFIVQPSKDGRGYSMGSGSLVDVEKRIVITNYHVISDGKICYCQFPVYQKGGELMSDKKKYIERVARGEAIKGEVLYQDSSRDLAIVKLASVPAGTPALPLSAKGTSPAATVWNIGSPGAVEQVFSITEGKVRAVGHQEFVTGGGDGNTFTVKAKMVTTTNPANPGDSGGPLLDKKGEMVGVTQSGNVKASLVSNFVDVSEVKAFLAEKKIELKQSGSGMKTVEKPEGKETPKTTDPKDPKTPAVPNKEAADEKAANAMLSAAKAYAKDEDLRAKYIAKLNEIIKTYPNTMAAKDAKRLLDGLK